MVDLLLRWAPLDAVAKLGAPTVTIALAWVLSVRDTRVLVGSKRGGRKSVLNVGVDRDGGLTLIFRGLVFY
jgi:hypothetical protein